MTTRAQNLPTQFSLRSLLAGLMWFALVLAVCVQYQQATTRQRESIEMLKAAGVLPATQVGGQPISRLNRAAQAGSQDALTR